MSGDYDYSAAMRQVYQLAALFGLCDLLLTGLVIVSIFYLAPPDTRYRWACVAVMSGVAAFLTAWHSLLWWN